MKDRLIDTGHWALCGALFLLCSGQAPMPQASRAQTGSSQRIRDRFHPPAGYTRDDERPGSISAFLRDLPLKPEGFLVHLYDGSLKHWQGAQAAVVDMSVGRRDLQQCADAVMRLHAEFLFSQGRKTEISFHFTNGFFAHFSRWMGGDRIRVKGNESSWVNTGKRGATHDDLMDFLNVVYTYAGTRSLGKDLLDSVPWVPRSIDLLANTGAAPRPAAEAPVHRSRIKSGDVFLQAGSPGHAVTVVDVATNAAGVQVFLLAQSYMPAQEIHVLKNPGDAALSPWFKLDAGDELVTPEWTFRWDMRMRWP